MRNVKGVGKENESLSVLGVGDIKIRSRVNDVWNDGIIQYVLYVPGLGATLFSIGAATDRGFQAIFDNDSVNIVKKGKNSSCRQKSRKETLSDGYQVTRIIRQ